MRIRVAASLLLLATSLAVAQQQILVPTRPLGDNSNAAASTTFVQNTLANPLTLSGLVTIGSTPYVAVGNYTGATTNSLLFAARGSTATPVTDLSATAVLQNTASVTGSGGSGANTLYASMHKRGTTAANDYHAAFFEMADDVGGASGAAVRGVATCNGGTNGNCSGATLVGVATVPYNFIQGSESQAFNSTGTDATTTFTAAKFAVPNLSSCAGTNKCDAGYLLNPNGTVPDIYGWLAPAGTIDSTGSVLKSNATTTNGIDFTNATISGCAFRSPAACLDPLGTAWVTFAPAPSCGTATFTVNTARFKNVGKTTFVEFDITLNAIGTCTTTITLTPPNNTNNSSYVGFTNSARTIAGMCLATVGANFSCLQTSAAAFAASDRIIGNGVYENQ